MRRRTLVILISIIVSTLLIIVLLRGISGDLIIEALRSANLNWLIVSFIFTLLSVILRGLRWRVLLAHNISPQVGIHVMGVTSMLNQLPLRLGELARSIITKRYDIPILMSVSGIVIERLLDLCLVIITLLFTIALLPNADPTVTQTAVILGILGMLAFGVLILGVYQPAIPRFIVSRLIKYVPFMSRFPLENMLDNVLAGLQILKDWKRFSQTILWTLIAWLASFISIWSAIRAFGITDQAIMFTLLAGTLASLSIAIPLTVASIGVLQGAVIFAGLLIDIDNVTATAVGLSIHGILIAGYLLLGIIGMFALSINISDLIANTADNDAHT